MSLTLLLFLVSRASRKEVVRAEERASDPSVFLIQGDQLVMMSAWAECQLGRDYIIILPPNMDESVTHHLHIRFIVSTLLHMCYSLHLSQCVFSSLNAVQCKVMHNLENRLKYIM